MIVNDQNRRVGPGDRSLRVLIACPGLGLAQRGFERFARDCFEALKDHEKLDLRLVKGGGVTAGREFRAATISRDALISRAIGRCLHRPHFWLEQIVFSLSVQPWLDRFWPDVVMLNEWPLARALAISRQATHQKFRILLVNAEGGFPPFPRGTDHVQQVTPILADIARKHGEPEERQTVLPYGVRIPAEFHLPSRPERAALRRRLRIPLDRLVLLSVGALNIGHKRLDYLIREVASLDDRRPFLVMLGAYEPETSAVLRLARKLLGTDFAAVSVPFHSVADYYRVADAVAHASDFENPGLVYAEAMAHGLPVLAHDFPSARFMLGTQGYFADFTEAGALGKLVMALDDRDGVENLGRERHQSVYARFSWDVLAPRYVEMLAAVGK